MLTLQGRAGVESDVAIFLCVISGCSGSSRADSQKEGGASPPHPPGFLKGLGCFGFDNVPVCVTFMWQPSWPAASERRRAFIDCRKVAGVGHSLTPAALLLANSSLWTPLERKMLSEFLTTL